MESIKMVWAILCAGHQRRHKHKEQTFGLSGRRGWDNLREKNWNIHIVIRKIDNQWEFDVWHRAQSWCSVTTWRDRVGREVGEEFKKEGSHVRLWPIPVYVWQKPSQDCKVIIHQLKKKIFPNSPLLRCFQDSSGVCSPLPQRTKQLCLTPGVALMISVPWTLTEISFLWFVKPCVSIFQVLKYCWPLSLGWP